MSQLYNYKNPPASAEDIAMAMQKCDIKPDAWIIRFWAQCDGAMIEDLVIIHSTDSIVERQQAYDISAAFPDHLLIGDDSGGRLVLMERTAEPRFYLQDSGNPFIEDAKVFSSLDALIKAVVEED